MKKTALGFIFDSRPDGIINIADGTNLERSLYLTICVRKLNIPMILAVNMKDECDKNKIRIDINKLSDELKIPVVFISSKTGEGFLKLINLLKNFPEADIHSYDAFNKKLEVYKETFKEKSLSENNGIYSFADGIFKKCVKKENSKKSFTFYADKLLLNKYTAFPAMAAFLGTVFIITFGAFGEFLTSLFLKLYETIIVFPVKGLISDANEIISSLISDGILKGGESVASFVPYLFILFFFVSFTEDSGYMSRMAYICDKPMRKLGLSGKSVVSLLLGFGCTLPSVMSARIIKSKRERDKTIFLAPFVSCGAKISVYVMFGRLFFENKIFILVFFMYALGIITLVLFARITTFKNTSEEVFTLELPPYRFPSLKSVLKTTFFQIKDFMLRAGSIVVVLSVVVWFLNSFDFSLSPVNADKSILSYLGRKTAWIFTPLGFGNYQACAALVSGLFAKESIVVSLCVMAGGIENIPLIFNKAQAVSFMVFALFYTPCLSASVAVIKESSSRKKGIFMLFMYSLVAYVVSFIVYRVLI